MRACYFPTVQQSVKSVSTQPLCRNVEFKSLVMSTISSQNDAPPVFYVESDLVQLVRPLLSPPNQKQTFNPKSSRQPSNSLGLVRTNSLRPPVYK